jgi:hypothetical protein
LSIGHPFGEAQASRSKNNRHDGSLEFYIQKARLVRMNVMLDDEGKS